MPNREPWTKLLQWYDASARDLPWRRTQDPYAVWVSEAMLQQTQVASVIPYFGRWMTRFPTVHALSKASEQEVLALWQGLGYYRRCRMLLQGAKWIVEQGMPKSRSAWLEVPGVGPYTAAAIASIAFGEPAGVVDGNVERVFARLTCCRESGARLLAKAREWADMHVPLDHPGAWNQALMELGAMICTPRDPNCHACPIQEGCIAKQTWTVDELPVRTPKRASVQTRRIVWAPFHDGSFGVRQIPAGQWSEGMWEFPGVAAFGVSDQDGESKELRALAGPGWLESLGSFAHAITHHRIRVEAWLLRAEVRSEDLVWRTAEELRELPLPSAQARVLRLAKSALGLIDAS